MLLLLTQIFCRSVYNFNQYISISPVSLLILPVSHGIQSKQQTGTSLRMAFLVPGRQLALQIDTGTYQEQTRSSFIMRAIVFIKVNINVTKL